MGRRAEGRSGGGGRSGRGAASERQSGRARAHAGATAGTAEGGRAGRARDGAVEDGEAGAGATRRDTSGAGEEAGYEYEYGRGGGPSVGLQGAGDPNPGQGKNRLMAPDVIERWQDRVPMFHVKDLGPNDQGTQVANVGDNSGPGAATYPFGAVPYDFSQDTTPFQQIFERLRHPERHEYLFERDQHERHDHQQRVLQEDLRPSGRHVRPHLAGPPDGARAVRHPDHGCRVGRDPGLRHRPAPAGGLRRSGSRRARRRSRAAPRSATRSRSPTSACGRASPRRRATTTTSGCATAHRWRSTTARRSAPRMGRAPSMTSPPTRSRRTTSDTTSAARSRR